MSEHNAIISIRNLNKQFVLSKRLFSRKKSVVNAVHDFSMDVYEGEVVGLIGESGSGKTTLARILLGLTEADEGSIRIDGTELTNAGRKQLREIRSRCAVVFQDPAANLNPRQTVESSITRPLVITGVPRREAKRKAAEALREVQMDESYLFSYPHQLSGGQQQRIAIARALVMRPKIMILDEPTSALDISVQAQVLNLLLDLQEEYSLTYLIVTHDLSVIRYVSDRIAVMYMGRLVEYGTTEDIINNSLHPYTKILINSVPVLDPEHRNNEKAMFSGEPGETPEKLAACRLAQRCPYAMQQCFEGTPPMQEVTPGHFAECFLLSDRR
ncbi:MAG: ABC transporter ATP-binding protein [Clostridiales bacterium]|jgi:oligopeptide/dipeptide ABC transporter ATP-binding protein|nr:ABC transporter ATP-binding protein [Clostridiales bacterium]